MHGYIICAGLNSSSSSRPIILQQRRIRFSVLRRAMSITIDQYFSGCFEIYSAVQRNFTFLRSIPAAFQISMKYSPSFLILLISPFILLFMTANQSATQKMKMPPAFVILFTLMAFKIPYAMCIRPDGSNPS